MEFTNIYSLFGAQVAKYRGLPAFNSREGEVWRSQTWNDFEVQVNAAACGLLAKGLTKGSSVAILAGNVPEWSIIDIAAIAAGGVGVGIYPTSSREQCEYIINHSDAQFVFVDTAAQLGKLSGLELPKVKEIFVLRHGTLATAHVSAFDDLLELGRSKIEELMPVVNQLETSAKLDDIAIMVYTSGTTGEPKGAMLSHRYILNSVESLRQSVPIFDSDIAFSYLPGCHVAERISGIYNRVYNGTPAYFVDDLSKLYQYMLEVRPTVFASLPRFFEKIHASIVAKHGENVTHEIVNEAFGGRMRLLTSGGGSASERDRPILRGRRPAHPAGVRPDRKYLRCIQHRRRAQVRHGRQVDAEVRSEDRRGRRDPGKEPNDVLGILQGS